MISNMNHSVDVDPALSLSMTEARVSPSISMMLNKGTSSIETTATGDITGGVTGGANEAKKRSTADFPRTISLDALDKDKKKKIKATSAETSTTVVPSSLSSSLSSSPFQDLNLTNILSEQSSCVLFATDEWFARAENLIKDAAPVFDPDLYCAEGKVMDGWETRRRRTEGHDWCVIAITPNSNTGTNATNTVNDVVGVEIDTAYFTGNQAPRISIEVANCNIYSSNDDVNNNKTEEEWRYTWMPGAIQRILNQGGIQGTGQTLSHIQDAKDACEQFDWKEIVPMTNLNPGYQETRMHYLNVDEDVREKVKGFTHVRVNYYPDGGVARLRLWGHQLEIQKNDDSKISSSSLQTESSSVVLVPSSKPYHHPELSTYTNGGQGLACSNKHYGIPENLIQPTYGKDMGDGWETARHPDRPPILIRDPVTNLIDNPLMDWAILKLGMGGASVSSSGGGGVGVGVSRIIIDTKHFKGNFPESVMVEGCNANTTSNTGIVVASDEDVITDKLDWFPLLNRSQMGPDQEHVFEHKLGQLMNCDQNVTHVRVSIYPDGGISRVRVYGQPANTE